MPGRVTEVKHGERKGPGRVVRQVADATHVPARSSLDLAAQPLLEKSSSSAHAHTSTHVDQDIHEGRPIEGCPSPAVVAWSKVSRAPGIVHTSTSKAGPTGGMLARLLASISNAAMRCRRVLLLYIPLYQRPCPHARHIRC